MSHDRGCSCGLERYEYSDCRRADCIRRPANANASAIHADDFASTRATPFTVDHADLVRDTTAGEVRGFYVGLDRTHAEHRRKGDWMQTFSGRQFWPLDPRVDEIEIIDIAAALAKLCRFGGQTLRFYSVAEHCVLLARDARWRGLAPAVVLCLLMHDASEAYLCDIIRPVKPALSNYISIETALMAAIALRFGLQWPMPAIVKEMVKAMVLDEQRQVMAPPPVPWLTYDGCEPLGVSLQFWTPEQAFSEFMSEYAACGGRTF